MKKSIIKKSMVTLSVIISALSVASVCTSCGKDKPEDESISLIDTDPIPQNTEFSISDLSEISRTAPIDFKPVTQATEAVSSIELMTTTTFYDMNAIREVPMGTQKEVTKPPTVEYEDGIPYYVTTNTDVSDVREAPKTVVTTAPPLTAGTYIGESPNADFYQQRIAIAGDSIAYGFNAYGFIPNEHNIATESLSMWNLDYFTFSTGMGLVDTVASVKPSLLYMSLGMNDVNMSTPEQFTDRYKSTIYEIRNRVPDINIVVAGITPVTADCGFVSNETIRSFNDALQQMVKDIQSNHVYYFDAYSVVSDPNTLALRPECTGGDGIHLTTTCYYDFLSALYVMLDNTSVKSHIEVVEAQSNVFSEYVAGGQ